MYWIEPRSRDVEPAAAVAGELQDDANDNWLLVFLNLLLVLLAFFIALMALKHQKALPGPSKAVPEAKRLERLRKQRAEARALRQRLAGLFQAKGLDRMATVDLHQGQPRIILSSGLVFDSASARLQPRARERLASVARILHSLKREVMIEGHTDNRPIRTRRYPSNWELSTARALAVLRLFIKQRIPPSRMEFAGYGAHRPQASNETPEGRQRNRRVEIKVR